MQLSDTLQSNVNLFFALFVLFKYEIWQELVLLLPINVNKYILFQSSHF